MNARHWEFFPFESPLRDCGVKLALKNVLRKQKFPVDKPKTDALYKSCLQCPEKDDCKQAVRAALGVNGCVPFLPSPLMSPVLVP